MEKFEPDNIPEAIANLKNYLGYGDSELADALSVSRPTISRWRRGKNLPHKAMRQAILDWLVKEFKRQG